MASSKVQPWVVLTDTPYNCRALSTSASSSCQSAYLQEFHFWPQRDSLSVTRKGSYPHCYWTALFWLLLIMAIAHATLHLPFTNAQGKNQCSPQDFLTGYGVTRIPSLLCREHITPTPASMGNQYSTWVNAVFAWMQQDA